MVGLLVRSDPRGKRMALACPMALPALCDLLAPGAGEPTARGIGDACAGKAYGSVRLRPSIR